MTAEHRPQAPQAASSSQASPRAVRHWRVRGRVQGVAFRWFTRQAARELALDGWVRNCPDGSVEVRVAGDVERLKELRTLVRRGPDMADVQQFDEENLDPSTPMGEGFEIRY